MNFNQNRGVYFAFVAAVISGFSIFLNKFAVGVVNPPILLTTVKNLLVAVLIMAVILAAGKFSEIRKLTKNELFLLVGIGVIGGAIPFYMFFTGLALIPAINAAILQKTLVIWVALLAMPILKEKMTPSQLIGVTLLFVSNFIVGGFKGFSFSKGELLIFGSTLFWAVEYMLARKALKSVSPDIVVAFRMGIGALLLVLMSLFSSVKANFTISSAGVFWVVLTSALLFGYVMTWYRALKYSPATLVTAILFSSTIITNILSAVFVTRSLSATFIVQSIMIVLGLGMFLLKSPRQSVQLSKE